MPHLTPVMMIPVAIGMVIAFALGLHKTGWNFGQKINAKLYSKR